MMTELSEGAGKDGGFLRVLVWTLFAAHHGDIFPVRVPLITGFAPGLRSLMAFVFLTWPWLGRCIYFMSLGGLADGRCSRIEMRECT